LVASLALTKQSKTQKFKGQALAGEHNMHASMHSHTHADKIECFINKKNHLQFSAAY
jgi:hypothetical protein